MAAVVSLVYTRCIGVARKSNNFWAEIEETEQTNTEDDLAIYLYNAKIVPLSTFTRTKPYPPEPIQIISRQFNLQSTLITSSPIIPILSTRGPWSQRERPKNTHLTDQKETIIPDTAITKSVKSWKEISDKTKTVTIGMQQQFINNSIFGHFSMSFLHKRKSSNSFKIKTPRLDKQQNQISNILTNLIGNPL
jgi:hypothetical protein